MYQPPATLNPKFLKPTLLVKGAHRLLCLYLDDRPYDVDCSVLQSILLIPSSLFNEHALSMPF